MNFTLFLTLQGVTWGVYGPHFESSEDDAKYTVCYVFDNDWDDADLFYDDIENINNQCGSLLSYGDIEYFDAEQCEKLLVWVEKRLLDNLSGRYRELLETLSGFCKRAIDLKTGVYIDL